MLKRMVSFFLTLAMVITMLPVQAIALETETEPAELILETEPVEEETEPEVEETVAENEMEAPTVEGEEYNSGETEAAVEKTESSTEETEPAAETSEPVEEEPSAPAEAETEAATEETEPSVEVTEPATEETVPATEEPILEKLETDPMLSSDTSGECGASATWSYNTTTKVLTISGTGAMENYIAAEYVPWYTYRNDIQSVVIEGGITNIGKFAFNGCDSLTAITIPETVTRIESSVFAGCRSLPGIALPSGLEYIGSYAFSSCDSLTSITIPDTVKTIDEAAFISCIGLRTAILPSGITELAYQLFYYCIALEEIVIPNSVTSIGDTVFAECNSLTSIKIPSGVTSIGSHAFSYCSNLTDVVFPDGITSIGDSAFWNCSSLTTLELPDNLQTIGENAFCYCDGLEIVKFPGTLLSIDAGAFMYCSNLSRIVFQGNAPIIESDVFENVTATAYYPDDNDTWATDVLQNYGGTISWVAVGDSVGGNCGENLTWEYNYNGLVISGTGDMTDYSLENPAPWNEYAADVHYITFAPGMTSIGDYAFAGLANAAIPELPDTLIRIGEGAFSGCCYEYFSQITIPSNVEQIGKNAFGGCTALSSVTFLGDVPQMEDGLFDGMTVSVKHVYNNTTWTEEARETFAGTITWYMCDANGTAVSGTCGTSANWFYDPVSATLTISGTGAMKDITGKRELPAWYHWKTSIETVVIESGITHIGGKSFSNSNNLKSVTIPDTVQTIGASAFSSCESLTDIQIPSSVTSIGNSAFANCIGLTEFEIPSSVTSIGNKAFAYCTGLTELVIPNSVTSIGNSAFLNCSSMTTLQLPDCITSIANNTFENCINLTELTIPDSVDSIGNNAFFNCEALHLNVPAGVNSIGNWAVQGVKGFTVDAANETYASQYGMLLNKAKTTVFSYAVEQGSYRLPDTTTEIYETAFYEHPSLTSINVPQGVEIIGFTAFAGCKALESVTFNGTVSDISEYAFSDCYNLTSITFKGNPPESISENAFANVTATAYHPAGHPDWTDAVKQNYGGTLTWTASEVLTSGACGEDLNWIYDAEDCILVISGTGAMTDYTAENPAPWSEYSAEIMEIAVDSGVTSIGSYAFAGLTQLGVVGRGSSGSGVTLPETLTKIGESAFAGCNSYLYKLTIPASVTEIGQNCFAGCTVMANITFQSDLPALADTLFSEDMSLIVYYPSDNATWTDTAKKNYGGNIAWYGVDESGNAVGTCGDALTWSYASTSRRLTISGTGAMADYSPENPAPWSSLASELRYLTIESGVTTIGNYAFAGMEQLGYVSWGATATGVTLPATLTKIGENAFTGCPKLAKLIFLGDLPVLADTAFSADMGVTAYYPYGNATWTEEARKEYDGAVVWYPCDAYGTAMGGSCGETVGWFFDPETATLTITGSGEMDNVSFKLDASPWNAWKSGIENVVIESGIINIGARAFSGISSLKNVTIPGTVEAIGASAFASCTGLTEVQIPAAVTTIPASTFSGCTGLTELKLPASVTTLEDYAFRDCTNLVLTFGSGVSDVGYQAVRNIKSIAVDEANSNFAAENGLLLSKDKTTVICYAVTQTSYVIPDTVTTIATYAFVDHDELTDVTIPEGVQTIDDYAFSGCTSLKAIDLPTSLTTLGMSAFALTGLTEVAIPENVEMLDYGVFENNSYLESVIFAGKVTAIGNDIFGECSNLESIRFRGDAPETIQPSAFYGVTATVYYPGDNATWTTEKMQQYGGTITWEVWEAPTSGTSGDNLTWEFDDWDGILTISGTGAMKNYSASNPAPWSEFADYLYEIIIESGVTSIGNYAFAGLPWVWDLQCPDTMTAIGDSAFRGYGSNFTEFTVPAGVTKIGKNAFADNPDLTRIIFQGDLPVLADTLFSEDMTLVAAYPQSNTTWTEAAQKNYGGTVAWYPIAEDGSLMGTCGDDLTWTFSNYMLTISGSGAMADYSLEKPAPWTALAGEVRYLTIESGVTSIGSYAFAGMYEMGFLSTSKTAPTLPETITAIGENAFSGCTSLFRMNFLGDLPAMADTIFSEDMTIELYYADGNATWTEEARKDYGGNVKWYRFDENRIDLEGSSSETADWQFDPATGTLTITGTGEVCSIGGIDSSGSWNEWTDKIKKVIIEDGITGIGNGAFQNCENLETAQLPNSVTTIGYYAFNGCSNLALTIPAGVSSLKYSSVQGVKAFSVDAANTAYTAEGGMLLNKDKTTLIAYAVPKTTYTIPATVTAIGESAFQGCSSLTEITIPDTVKTIETYAFAECPNLTTVNLPQGIVLLEHRVFAESGLTEIIIPDSVEEIDIRVFESCEKLEKVVFAGESKVHTIDYCAFDGCTSLKTIELPGSVTTLGDYAFCNSGLTRIRIPAGMKTIGSNAFSNCEALESVVFEGTLEEVYPSAFAECNNLQNIRFKAEAPASVWEDVFYNVTAMAYYPENNTTWTDAVMQSFGGYVTWAPWETATRGTCGDGLTWQYDEWDGILTISGTGAMTDYSDGTAPWANCNVKSIVLAEGVTTIGSYAFVDTGVSQIQLPEGLVSIGEYALPRELTSLDIPASLTSVYFENLTQLEQFNVAAGNTVFADVDGVLFSKDMTRLIRMPECWVKEWDKQSFIAYTVPDTVVELGEGSFEGCSFLKNIVLPDALQIIGERAIACYDADVPKGPETIILPVAVNAIGTNALTSAKLVVFTGDAPTMAETVFSTCAKTAYYPANNATWTQEKLLDYGGDLTWIPYETEMPTSGELSDTISWNFDEETATLTIDGTGVMAGYDYTYLHSSFITPWLHLTDKVRHVVIEEGITEIGNRIFKNHQLLETVTLPESLQVICDSAFYNNPELKTVTMPEGVLTIEQGAFNGCSALESIRIPDTVTTIGDYAFSNCSNLKTVELSENLQQIGNCAFAGCAALTELLIPASVTTIGACAFEACTSLRMITFTGDAPAMLGAVFTDVIASVTYPAENTTWTEDVLQQYGGIITWIPVTSVANRIVMKNADLDGAASVWIDGKEYAVTAVNGSCYVDLPDGNAKTLVTYAYHAADSGDPHTQYPVSMKVWTLENTDGFYQVTRQAELDDILRYEGSSIRVTGTQGVRMITSVDQNDKAALTGEGLAGYTLKEYGTVIAWASRIRKSTPLVLNQSYVSSNHAYSKAEGQDPIFAYQDGRMQYTNVVVGYTMDQCKNDIAMRPYMILEDASGNEITLYGGIVNRSIGYIAYQNRNTFDANTEAYAYIWKIIHHVYGDAYDAEYKG